MGTWPGNPPDMCNIRPGDFDPPACRHPNCDCGIQGCGRPSPQSEPNWRRMYEAEVAAHEDTKKKLAALQDAYSNISWMYQDLSR